ncbi:hypothetical protein LTR37_000754 [Vermiconidia calcicola]|uniref:Uncharacterized protein n=1 Tax=Vermiconidia calcicola TaxID=1690605 RepID=A0ACC3NYM3_9PEZI|nr:hypothetical protein LTR37_000754 [Vermiconidia calcicola]
MPSSRRLKATTLLALLTICIMVYITHGASSTHSSPFYTRTVEAIRERQSAESRADMLAEEKQRLERVERLEREHNVAMGVAREEAQEGQKPILPAPAPQQEDAGKLLEGNGKSVAGRKIMPDGKVVHDKSGKESDDDGVAKVGNVGPQSSKHAVVGEREEDFGVQDALNEILRKGPIIIFSKSYCPFSKKAKHILLDLYTITPPPYVVELDQHELGSGLQSALERTTGRRTVPNILINGRSIGGGDDVQELHEDGKLASTIQQFGGKRVFKIEPKTTEEDDDRALKQKRGLTFKA